LCIRGPSCLCAVAPILISKTNVTANRFINSNFNDIPWTRHIPKGLAIKTGFVMLLTVKKGKGNGLLDFFLKLFLGIIGVLVGILKLGFDISF